MESIAWIAILIVMLVVEIVTTGLTTIWFCGGAAVALAVVESVDYHPVHHDADEKTQQCVAESTSEYT